MGYGFADVEAALAEVHRIPEERRSPFSNRLKHLQRLGFPPGVNTGRGRAATYFAEHAFLLAVALQLTELSVTPERAIRLIEISFAGLAGGAFAAVEGEAILCEVPASTLQDIVHNDHGSVYEGLVPFDRAYAAERLEFMLKANGPVRWSMFSITGLIERLSDLLPHGKRPDGFPDFKSRLAAWAAGVGSDEAIWRGANG